MKKLFKTILMGILLFHSAFAIAADKALTDLNEVTSPTGDSAVYVVVPGSPASEGWIGMDALSAFLLTLVDVPSFITAGSINDTMLDFGLGTNQVGLLDFPADATYGAIINTNGTPSTLAGTAGTLFQFNGSGAPTAVSTLAPNLINLTSATKYQVNGGQLSYDDLEQSGAATPTGAWDFGGATSLEAKNSDDPDVAATGQFAFDTDGWWRVYVDSLQKACGRTQEEIHFNCYKPNDMVDAVRDAWVIYTNVSGMTFVVTGWVIKSTSDNTDLNIEEIDADGANNSTVDAVSITTDGTGLFYGTDSTITAPNIENGHQIPLDFDDTDTPNAVWGVIYGYYLGDVN